MSEFQNPYNSKIDREPSPKLDALIVLGHNLSPWPIKDIRQTPGHISQLTKLNVIAAGILCKKGITTNVVFSTGQTFGLDMPSEAYVMEEFWVQRFPELAHIQRVLEVDSFDTAGNGEKVTKLLQGKNYMRLALSQINYTSTTQLLYSEDMVIKLTTATSLLQNMY